MISFEKYNIFNIFSSNDVSTFYKSLHYINDNKDLINHYKCYGSYYIEDIFKIYLGDNKFLEFKKSINLKNMN